MYFIACRHLLLQLPHGLFDLLAQLQLVGCFFSRQTQIDGVQAVYSVVAGRFRLHMHHLDELVQSHQCTVGRLQTDILRMKLRFLPRRSTHQPNPLLAILPLLDGTDAQEFLFIMSVDSLLDVRQGDIQLRKLHIVVFQLPFHRSSPGQIHLIYPLQLSQCRLDVLLGISVYQDRGRRCIQCISHERTVRIFIRTAGMNLRIAHPLGQLRPSLPHDGRHLETGGIHIGMLVHLKCDAPATVVRSGVNALHSLHTAQHGLQPTGHFRLDDTRRVARHGERHRQSRKRPRGRKLDRQQRHQRQTDQ